jgi:UDP-N-acetylmuramate--alanine ligase
MLGRTKKIHFVGIGGVGMSGIAEFLHNQNFTITGSDLNKTETTRHLESLGITVHQGHNPLNVSDVDVVVKSSAVNDSNPEVAYALSQKIPVIRRAEMLAELMRMSYGIAIAGTHGKTTTTSMVGLVLMEAGLDPTVIVGGKVKNFGSNNILGSGKHIVVEADEYDRSFLTLTPIIAGITNIEADHLDCYKNLDDIKCAFIEYGNKVPFFGSTVVCLDDRGVQAIIPQLNKRIITYGLTSQADVRASNIENEDFRTSFNISFQGQPLGRIMLNIPGIHNVQNALQAISIAIELDIPFEQIKRGLERFTGVFRRFEMKGQIGETTVFDDYAHHPTEIITTLRGIRDNTYKRVVAIFQPHLYSRTRDFSEDFGRAFFYSDLLIVTPIYPAREKEIPGVTGELIASAAIKSGHKNVLYIDKNEEIISKITPLIHEDDCIITIGAGDIYKYGEQLIERLKEGVKDE